MTYWTDRKVDVFETRHLRHPIATDASGLLRRGTSSDCTLLVVTLIICKRCLPRQSM
jgi:hypothetical protein